MTPVVDPETTPPEDPRVPAPRGPAMAPSAPRGPSPPLAEGTPAPPGVPATVEDDLGADFDPLAKLRKGILPALLLAAAVGVAGLMLTDGRKLLQALASFDLRVAPLLLLLASLSYLFRFLKFHRYLRILDIPVSRGDSLRIFLAGFSMTVTPGKVGEVVKSWFLKRLTGVRMSRTAPAVLAERLTDLIAMLLLAMMGFGAFGYGRRVLLVTVAVIVVPLAMLLYQPATDALLRVLERFPRLRPVTSRLHHAFDSCRVLLAPRALLYATVVSVVAWFCECWAFQIALAGFDRTPPVVEAAAEAGGVVRGTAEAGPPPGEAAGRELVAGGPVSGEATGGGGGGGKTPASRGRVGVLPATFIYAFSAILGAITFLPGGLGSTEASLSGLLVLLHVPKATAFAATLVIRAATLWYAVVLGILAVLHLRRRGIGSRGGAGDAGAAGGGGDSVPAAAGGGAARA